LLVTYLSPADKNPELQEFASEVTKIINKAVEEMPTD
jgi:hypothetical protein